MAEVNLATGPPPNNRPASSTHKLGNLAPVVPMTPTTARSTLPQITADEAEAEAASLFPVNSTPGSENRERRCERNRKIWTAFTHLGVFLLVMGVFITCFIFAPIMPSYIGAGGWVWLPNQFLNVGVCDSNGNFQADLYGKSFWSSSGAFQITLGFGSMPFFRAKALDVAWDIVVGRCGQGLLAYISYRVFTKCLYRHMELSPVSLDVFESITLRDISSPASISCLIKDFFTNATTRARLSMAWIVFASIYLLFFQTLMSAMTGYSATSSPYVSLPDGTQRHWSDFRIVYYVINDARRLGLQQDNYIISNIPAPEANQFDDGCRDVVYYPQDYSKDMTNACSAVFEASNYTFYYGFNGQEKTTSNFSLITNSTPISQKLDSPALNISAFFLPDYYTAPPNPLSPFPSSISWQYASNDRLYKSGHRFSYTGNASLIRYALRGQTSGPSYDLSYLHTNGVCQQDKNYQWGFSALLLFFAMLLTAVWAVGMWAMWLDAFFQSRLDYHDRAMGNYRALLDMAQVLQDALGERDATEMLSDAALRQRMKATPAVIGYQALVGEKAARPPRSTRFKRWYRRGWKGWTFWERAFVMAIPGVSFVVVATVLPSVLVPGLTTTTA